jgi:hypothetical protein
MRIRRWLACALFGALNAGTIPAAAHGPPASVTGIAARDDAGVRVVTLSEGLGIRLPGGWRWICSSAFGTGTELMPPAQSIDGEHTFVIGAADLFVLESDGAVVPQSRPDLSRQSVLQLASLGSHLYALRFAGGQSDVVDIGAGDAGAIWRAPAPYQSLNADDDSLWVATVLVETGQAFRLSVDGTVLETVTFAVDAGDRVTRVQRVGGDIFVNLVTSAAGGTIGVIDAEGGADAGPAPVLSSVQPVEGPVAAGDSSAWVESNATLQSVGGDAAVPFSTSYPVTCVAGSGDDAYLCAQTRLLALGSAGPAQVLFDLDELVGPQPFPDDAGICAAQWDYFHWDLSRAGIELADASADGPDAGGARPPSSSGCRCAIPRPEGWRWLPAVGIGALLSIRARRRAHAGRP